MSGLAAWGGLLPAVLVAAGLLLLPGLAVLLALRVRGLLAVALAPPVSVALVAVAAVLATPAGVRFGLLPVLLLTALAVGLAAAVGPWAGAVVAAERGERWGAATGWAVGALAGAAVVVRATGAPDAFPQQFDSVFHLNAAWHVLTTGAGSSLGLGQVTAPGRAGAFYPAAWHDLTALVAQLTGVTVVEGATAMAVGIAVIWPLGVLSLMRVAYGVHPLGLVAAGGLAAAIPGAPLVLLGYGTLWPNALATVLLPAMLAVVAVLVGAGRESRGAALSRRRAGAVALVSAPGLALAHPNAVVTLGVLAVLLMVLRLVGHASALARAGAWGAAASWAAVAAAVVAVTTWVLLWSPLFAANRRSSWPAGQTMAQATGEWLLLGPQRAPTPVVVAALALVGAVVVTTRPALRQRAGWLVVVHATLGALFVVVAGSDAPWAQRLGAPWWDDPYRMGALAAVGALPLAATGVVALAEQARRALPSPSPGAMTAGAVLAVVALAGVSAPDTAHRVAVWHEKKDLAGPAELALLRRLPQEVPKGQRVAGTPWNGAALAQAVGDREVVFPHLVGTWDGERQLLAAHLRDAADSPSVCRAVTDLGARWVLDGPVAFWPGDERQPAYRGLSVAGREGFEEVDRGGRLTLYRVTACRP